MRYLLGQTSIARSGVGRSEMSPPGQAAKFVAREEGLVMQGLLPSGLGQPRAI
jgi:hypothetical protein